MLLSNAALKNRTTVLVLIVLVVFAGVASYLTLPREAAPDVKIPYVLITTVQDGLSPADVENTITKKIEKELAGLKGLKEFNSTSAESTSGITIEFLPDVDIEDALQRVKDKVDIAKKELPADAEEPIVREINIAEMPIMLINISGPLSPVRLKAIAEELEDRIESIPGVLGVDIHGALEREIRIEVDPDRVAAYGLALSELLALIPSENVNVSAGGMETEGTKFNVRVPAEFQRPTEVDRLLLAVRNGRPIYLSDVAGVRDTFKDRLSYSRLNGHPSITVAVRKRIGENIVEIAGRVQAILAAARDLVPRGVKIDVVLDQSDEIRMMVSDLENNIVTALALVVGVMILFMGLRSSLIVACAIPLSMLMSFALIQAIGLTLNMIVLFSLILALGMLVDNAIVIVENVYRHREMGFGRIEAAMKGTAEVAWPVIASTATTLAAFGPLLFWPGMMGDFMKYLPMTVIIVLSSSLFVALVVTPVICSVFLRRVPVRPTERPEPMIVRGYRWLLTRALSHRGTTLAMAVLVLIGVGMFYGKRSAGVELFPDIDPRQAVINIRCSQGTNIRETDRLTRLVEGSVEGLRPNPEIGADNIKHINANVGSAAGNIFFGGDSGPHVGNVTVIFPDFEDRKRKSADTVKEIRKALAWVTGPEIKVEKQQEGPPTGSAVTVRIIGEDLAVLEELSERAKKLIVRVPNLVNLRSDLEAARPELSFRVDRERAMLLGVNTRIVGQFLKTQIFGTEVGKFREFNDEYDITIRLPESQRVRIEDLLRLRVPNLRGQSVPLSSLGRFTYAPGLGTIHRFNQKRVVTLTGDAEGRLDTAVLADAQRWLSPLGYSPLIETDIADWPKFCARLVEAGGADAPAPLRRIWGRLDQGSFWGGLFGGEHVRPILNQIARDRTATPAQRGKVLAALNALLNDKQLHDADAFPLDSLTLEARNFLRGGTDRLEPEPLQRLNRLLLEAAFPKLLAARQRVDLPPGYEIRYAGKQEEMEKAQEFLSKAFIFAILLIVGILVTQFNTLSAPVIIMSTVILSTVGVFIGLLVLDIPFGVIMTGVGVISLAGVVVNNAIVLLDYTRKLQKGGMDVISATIQAGVTRLRPVLLTAATTILGLIPMVVGVSFDIHEMGISWKSESSQWWRTMASAVIFGLAFATLLTLVVVPAFYVMLHRMAARFGFGGLQPAQPAEPKDAPTV